MRVLGAILAGGEARRFGRDKALAEWAGAPLIAHVAAALVCECDALVVCGRHYLDLPVLVDRPRTGLGPLGALAAALHHASRYGFDAVLSAPCDTPHLPALRPLLEPSGYLSGTPVIGLWPAQLADHLDRWLAADRPRAVRAWAEAAGIPAVTVPPVANVNTPADLALLSSPRT